jgi:hypothetical protein
MPRARDKGQAAIDLSALDFEKIEEIYSELEGMKAKK